MSFLSLFVLIQWAMLVLSQASPTAVNETMRLKPIPTKPPHASPPFWGSIYLDPDIITGSDPTTFVSLIYIGRGNRFVYDRRPDKLITINAYLFRATFNDSPPFEVQVNPEFGSISAASAEARKYSTEIGRIPKALRRGVKYVVIHSGYQPFGGGSDMILIHTGLGNQFISQGILEEALVHEGSHTSLDRYHASAPKWLFAQRLDPTFISKHAQDHPSREDIAESFLLYLAVRYRKNRISETLYDTIMQTIPNRIEYFSAQRFKMNPIR